MRTIHSSVLTGVRLVGVVLLLVVMTLGSMGLDRASAANTFAAGAAVVTTDSVNVRTRAGTSAPIRAVAPAGTSFTIGQIRAKRANNLTWYRVSTPRRVNYGWIASDFLALDAPFEEGDCAIVIDGSLNLRSAAGTGKSVIKVLADGTGVKVLGTAPVAANGYVWIRVSVIKARASDPTVTGWVVSEFLQEQNCGSTDAGGLVIGATVRVVNGPLNARVEPDTSANVQRLLADGAVGTITDGPVTADGFTWFEFRNDVVPGWVVADFIEVTPDDVGIGVGDDITVNTDALNVRSTAGIDGDVIDTAAFGALGTRVAGLVQTVDELLWIKVSIPNVGTGWVVLDYVTEV